ncbi:MAG: hypothetical protein PHF25_00790 [Candidatus Margulisbacteria bacterium]|nr:hypothetical protein [Candidatus Margulisiibacteriota bacterium]
MLKSKYQVQEDWNPKVSKEVKEKRQTKNLSTVASYQEEGIVEDLMSWLD